MVQPQGVGSMVVPDQLIWKTAMAWEEWKTTTNQVLVTSFWKMMCSLAYFFGVN
jgi:hypothetical protein